MTATRNQRTGEGTSLSASLCACRSGGEGALSPLLQSPQFFLMRSPSELVHIYFKSRVQVSKVLWFISNPPVFCLVLLQYLLLCSEAM